MILAYKKQWEIRGSRTKIRGTIGLIPSGSGTMTELRSNPWEGVPMIGNSKFDKAAEWLKAEITTLENSPSLTIPWAGYLEGLYDVANKFGIEVKRPGQPRIDELLHRYYKRQARDSYLIPNSMR